MVKNRFQDTASFKISQYLLAILIGIFAAWMAPKDPAFSPQADIIQPPLPPTDRSIVQWWAAGQADLALKPSTRSKYPWVHYSNHENKWFHTLTKDDFRCRGKFESLPITIGEGLSKQILFDCWGRNHGLPWIDEQEFVYPALIDILNDLQQALRSSVCITSAHRCPAHHRYITQGQGSSTDKHLIAAAVDFYIQGWHSQKHDVIKALRHICQRRAPEGQKERWSLEQKAQDLWANSEIELRWYPTGQDHSLDNDHPYPFWQITLRYDTAKGADIRFDTKTANQLPLD